MPKPTAIAKRVWAAPTTKAVKETHEGEYGSYFTYKSVPTGIVRGSVELRIDVDALFQRMARSALLSKSGKSRGLGGCVVMVALSRTHEVAD